jgi:hypothetical protein
MASSRAEPATPSPIVFALQELTACWNQGYEALARGDLDRLGALLDLADDHVLAAGDGRADGPDEARLRDEAMTARGRLDHGMRAGLAGVAEELAQTRRGAKVLRGYGQSALGVGEHLQRDA